MWNIAIFASGNGSNAENFFNYFKNNEKIKISAVFCDNPQAYVIKRAENNNINCVVFSRKQLNNQDFIIEKLETNKINFIVLAGFLGKIPNFLVEKFEKRIVNIHPSLLPKYGGKGMYGHHVHQAVIDNKEKFSGITIHYVNNVYDDGEIIFQAKCLVLENDTADTLANRVHQLEYQYFTSEVEKVINSTPQC